MAGQPGSGIARALRGRAGPRSGVPAAGLIAANPAAALTKPRRVRG